MKKSEYIEKLQYENKNHINNIFNLIKTLNVKISELKRSKASTDRICERFGIRCYEYNLVYEMEETKNKIVTNLEALTEQIQKIISRNSKNIDYDIQKLSSINDLLDSYEVQLKSINRNDVSNVENLSLNAIKKEIYEAYMKIRAEIDKQMLKTKFDKIQNRSPIKKAFENFFVLTEFVEKKRENLFIAIQGIDEYKSKYIEASEPTREYRVIDIITDIEIYLNENKKAKKYNNEYAKLLELREKIYFTFSIDKRAVKKCMSEKYKSKLPMPVEKNVSKIMKKHQKAMEFLYKGGYIKTYNETVYKSEMKLMIEKIKLLSENVERELKR